MYSVVYAGKKVCTGTYQECCSYILHLGSEWILHDLVNNETGQNMSLRLGTTPSEPSGCGYCGSDRVNVPGQLECADCGGV